MSLSDDLTKAITKVSKDWKKAKKQDDQVSRRQLEKLRKETTKRKTTREVAFAVMEGAYNKASAKGEYYANARQIMYAARPAILYYTGIDELDDVYFTQTLV